MYIRLIRNKPQGNAITGRLVIDGRWFCNTLERVGYQIPALCYHIAVTQSPKFKRLLPLVCGVPQTVGDKAKGDKAMRQGIRIHRGSKPEHSTGCILVVADNPSRAREFLSRPEGLERSLSTIGAEVVENNVVDVVVHSDHCRSRDILISPDGSNDRFAYDSSGNNRSNECEIRMLSPLSSIPPPVGCRSAADVEQSLTQLLLQSQTNHETIIFEVFDFHSGTEYGYDTPCPPELQKP